MLHRPFGRREGRYTTLLVSECLLTKASSVILVPERTTYDYGNHASTHV